MNRLRFTFVAAELSTALFCGSYKCKKYAVLFDAYCNRLVTEPTHNCCLDKFSKRIAWLRSRVLIPECQRRIAGARRAE